MIVRRIFTTLAVAVAAAVLAACYATVDRPDLPQVTSPEITCGQSIPAHVLELRPLENGVPDEFARFRGVWVGGKWAGIGTGDGRCHALVVTSVTKSGRANVIYIWGGKGTIWKTGEGWRPFFGTISNQELVFEQLPWARFPADVRYTLRDGELKGEYIRYKTGKKYYVSLRMLPEEANP